MDIEALEEAANRASRAAVNRIISNYGHGLLIDGYGPLLRHAAFLGAMIALVSVEREVQRRLNIGGEDADS